MTFSPVEAIDVASAAPPGLWCFAGPPGSGKSTLGRAVAARVGACMLDLDTATNPLIAHIAALTGAGDDLDHPSLRGAVRSARYRCLTDLAAENVRVGRSVVLVAPFTREGADAEAWQQLAHAMSPAVPFLIWVDVPPAVALQRRQQRRLARDRTASLLTGHELGAEFPRPVVDHLLANGAAPTEVEAERLAGLLGGPGTH
jgi:predicted kinase